MVKAFLQGCGFLPDRLEQIGNMTQLGLHPGLHYQGGAAAVSYRGAHVEHIAAVTDRQLIAFQDSICLVNRG